MGTQWSIATGEDMHIICFRGQVVGTVGIQILIQPMSIKVLSRAALSVNGETLEQVWKARVR